MGWQDTTDCIRRKEGKRKEKRRGLSNQTLNRIDVNTREEEKKRAFLAYDNLTTVDKATLECHKGTTIFLATNLLYSVAPAQKYIQYIKIKRSMFRGL